MALQGQQLAWSFPAAASMASSQYYFGLVNSSGNVAVNTVNGGFCTGIIDDNVSVVGAACRVVLAGITKVIGGAAITRGALVMSDASGKAITATSGGVILGQILETGASGTISTIFLFTGGSRP